ncbi:unnamed protein product [Malus baccata var. baccata]
MKDEFLALQQTGTCSLVPSSHSTNVVGCKWVFRIKRKPAGTIDRYKARLVAKGFHQQAGLDYTKTFSPVAKPLDVSNAFLHDTLYEQVFMQQPPGFKDSLHPNYICHLHKSLYGLKQAPRAWYDKLHGALTSLGFTGSQSDHSLFVKTDLMVFILVYVDDIIVTGPSTPAYQQVITQLRSMFPIKDLSALHYFLGIEVKRSSKGIYISQTKYILDLLKKANMDGAKPCATPLSTSQLDHTSPYWTMLLNTDLFWSAKKQPTIARSSTEAEYRSLANTAAKLTWICKLLVDIAYKSPSLPQLWCDNISALSLAKNPLLHARTKHVKLDYHYIREKVLAREVSVHYICTQQQVADICTKALAKDRFHYLRSKLSLRTPQLSLRGATNLT